MANLGPLRGRADSTPRRSLVWASVLPVFRPWAPGAGSDKFLPEPSVPPRASLSPGNRMVPQPRIPGQLSQSTGAHRAERTLRRAGS